MSQAKKPTVQSIHLDESNLPINTSPSSETIREISALTDILRDELIMNMGVQKMVVCAMTKEGPVILHQDPITGIISQLPISKNCSIQSVLS